MDIATSNKKPLLLFLILGLITGIIYTAIYKYTSSLHNLSFNTSIKYIAIGLTVSYAGLMIALAYDGEKTLRLIIESIIVAAIFGFIASYVSDNNGVYSGILLAIATFAGINFLHIYHQANYKTPAYTSFFNTLWNNICGIVAAAIFLLLTNIFLFAWAGLFSELGIHQLFKLLTNQYFIFLANPIFYALGLYISLRWEKILNSMRMIIFNFFAVLLPITTVFGWLMFIASLVNIFTTSSNYVHSWQCLTVAFWSVIFINTAYQDGESVAKLSKLYKTAINLLVILIPFLVALGVYLQVKHSVAPLINRSSIGFFVFSLLLFVYGVVYLCGIFAIEHDWLSSLKRGNVVLAWVMIAFGIILNINFITKLLPRVKQSKSSVITNKQKADLSEKRKLNYIHSFAKSGLRWSKSGSALVFGYRHNKAIHVCRIDNKNTHYFGVVEKGSCLAIIKEKIVARKNYQLLTGSSHKLQWYDLENQPALGQNLLYLHHDIPGSSQINLLCRVIYNNRIYVGSMHNSYSAWPYLDSITAPCMIVVASKVVSAKVNSQLAYLPSYSKIDSGLLGY